MAEQARVSPRLQMIRSGVRSSWPVRHKSAQARTVLRELLAERQREDRR